MAPWTGRPPTHSSVSEQVGATADITPGKTQAAPTPGTPGITQVAPTPGTPGITPGKTQGTLFYPVSGDITNTG